MFLGQLFYYDAKLNQLPLAIEQKRLDLIDLCGVDNTNPELIGLSSQELSRKLKDIFSKNYINILHENELHGIGVIWKTITSAHIQFDSMIPRSEYQSIIVEWAVDGYAIDKIMALVKEGQLAQNVDDFALYYGIKVLFELTTLGLEGIYQPSHLSHSHFISDIPAQDPSMIVVTNQRKSPLFKSVSCVTILPQDDIYSMVRILKEKIIEMPTIQIILLDYPLDDYSFQQISKSLPDVLVSQFDLDELDSRSSGFFKAIAKQTLGIRL